MTDIEDKIAACDPRGLFHEVYKDPDMVIEQCRGVFFDWAISDEGGDAASMQLLLDYYGSKNPDHPMTGILQEGLKAKNSVRAGGSRGRRTKAN